MKEENNFSSCSDVENEEKEQENIEEQQENVESDVTELEAENEALKKEMDELKDKFLRLNAEYDNYRKRTTREKSEIYTNASIDVISSILPILDNLERANSSNSDLDSLKTGIEMVIKLFKDSLKNLGIEEIESTGEFNPNLHEAVMHVSDDTVEANTIIEVLQKGYVKNGKVIRHSMVKVAN